LPVGFTLHLVEHLHGEVEALLLLVALHIHLARGSQSQSVKVRHGPRLATS
jgi:hypothetical protein